MLGSDDENGNENEDVAERGNGEYERKRIARLQKKEKVLSDIVGRWLDTCAVDTEDMVYISWDTAMKVPLYGNRYLDVIVNERQKGSLQANSFNQVLLLVTSLQ